MEQWMNQGTTMIYNNVENDSFFCNKYGFNAIELKYNMICDYSEDYILKLSKMNKVPIGSLSGVMMPVLQDSKMKEQCKTRFYNMCR